MAPKKNGFFVFMCEAKQELANKGIKKSMSDMPKYCKEKWEKIPDNIKEEYKKKAKQINNGEKIEKYTSIGEKIEDVKKESETCKSLANAMYLYIEMLVQIEGGNFIPKQKFIFVHINSYNCKKEDFSFPAEITMVEFSLERGLIRIIHELLGFDKTKTFAPMAPTAEINMHAKNDHQITTFTRLPIDYKATFFRLISFIIQQEVDENTFHDFSFDLPPIYTAQDSTEHDLAITSSSMFQLYKSAVSNPMNKADFCKILKVYQLDKLFMEIKNKAHSLVNPDSDEKALPSVALASDNLTKDMLNTIKTIGCTFHEKLEQGHVCSNYYVCKWMYIFSTHCCHYFKINIKPGFHYDFDLSKTEIPIVQDIRLHMKDLEISNSYVTEYEKSKKKTNKFPALGGKSTTVQPTTWGKPNKPANQPHVSNKSNNFPPLNSFGKNVSEHTPASNSWGLAAGREEGSKVQDNYKVPTGFKQNKTADQPPASNNINNFPPLG